jgi:hypothetical protein
MQEVSYSTYAGSFSYYERISESVDNLSVISVKGTEQITWKISGNLAYILKFVWSVLDEPNRDRGEIEVSRCNLWCRSFALCIPIYGIKI